MGDGHHGWAAAEVLLAARDAFVYERWHASGVPHTLELLAGIPPEWFVAPKESRIVNAPIPEGFLNIAVTPGERTFFVELLYRKGGVMPPGGWKLRIPFLLDIISAQEGKIIGTTESGNETVIDVVPGDTRIEMTIRK